MIWRAAWLAAIVSAFSASSSVAVASNGSESAQQDTARSVPTDARWSLLLRDDDKVVFRGVIDSDTRGAGTAQLLYPAPSAAGLLAAVITHGLLVESAKNSEKEKLLEAANKVLLPYRQVLNDYRKTELMQRGLGKTSLEINKRLLTSAAEGASDWLFESTPIFSITQDQRAIVLDSNIALYPPGASSAAMFQYSVRVVSQAKDPEDLVGLWTANQGEMLKDTSADLFAQSLDIALKEAMGAHAEDAGRHRTVRYQEGGIEKMERAQILGEECDRVLLKTLRGSLMSVPTKQNAAAQTAAKQCGNLPAAPK